MRLRPIEIRPFTQAGQELLLLRDPLRLAENYVIVPQALTPLLALLDGSYERAALADIVGGWMGARSGPDILGQLLDALDQALLLDNETFRAARARVTEAYRAAPFRPPALAGLSYPADPRELRELLDGYLDAAGDVELSDPASRGLLSPHIDYMRGGPVYAQVWKSALAAARQAELVVVLATDHYSPAPLTLTRQSYATPYGVLPTDAPSVDAIAEAVGEEVALGGELHHRGEHSVELVATWLHHMRGGEPVALVPVLCGSFARFVARRSAPENDAPLGALLGALREVARERRTLVVISGDLSHVGPAFGGAPLDEAAEARLRADDEAVIERLRAGDAAGLLDAIARIGDRNNVCGLPPAYLALRLLGAEGAAARGELFGYARCPADDQDTSAVTVAGMVFV